MAADLDITGLQDELPGPDSVLLLTGRSAAMLGVGDL